MAALLAITRLNLRRLRRDGAAPWVLAGVVLLAAFWATATPRFFNSVSDEALATAVTSARPLARNIIIEQGMRISAGAEDPFGGVEQRAAELAAQLSPPVEQIIGTYQYVVDSQTFDVSKLPDEGGDPPARRLTFRYQQDIDRHIRLIDGALPAPAAPVEITFPGAPPLEVPVFQVAITQPTSDLMRLGVGDRAVLSPQARDPLTVGVPLSQLAYRLIVEVSGIVEPTEPDAEYWMSDRRIHQPSLEADAANPDAIVVSATGLMGGADYERLLTLTRSALWGYSWRFFVDPDRFDASDVEAIGAGLQDLQLRLGSPALAAIDEPRLTTGLERIFSRYQQQRELTVSILSVTQAGLLSLSLAVIALLGALNAHRRRAEITLARSRGGSSRQLGAARLLEAILLFLPVALIGYLAARFTVDGREPSFLIPGLLAGVGGVAALATAPGRPLLRGNLGELIGTVAPDRSRPIRRLVVEATLGAAAVGGLVVFRLRGLQAGGISGDGSGFDPLLAAVPVLLALALGIALLRLYPIMVRGAGRLGRTRRDVVAFVGVRRLDRQSPAAQLPLPVTLLAVGIAIFGALLVDSIAANREAFTWQSVGADYAIESLRSGVPLPASLGLSDLPQVQATADSTVVRVRLGDEVGSSERAPMVVLETAAYQEVTAGTGADAQFPESILLPVVGGDEPVPAVVSSGLPGRRPAPGEILLVEGPRQVQVRLLVRDVRSRFPGFAPGEPFIVVPRASVDALSTPWDLRPTRRYVRATVDAGPAIESAVLSQSVGTLVVSRAGLLEELSGSPLVKAVDRGYRSSVVLATGLAVLAALAAIALTAHDRARDLGYLRTMGLSTPQVTALTVLEQLPWAVIATGAGAAFAIVLTRLIQPGLDLSPFTGSETTNHILVDWGTVLAVAGGVLLALLLATALYSYRARRLNLGDVLRLGDRG